MERDIQGKRFVLVGGTGGIGQAVAHELARREARLLLVGRGEHPVEPVLQRLREAGAREVSWLQADLSSVAGTDRAALGVLAWGQPLDGVLHTAMSTRLVYEVTPDGLEWAFGLQYLARASLNLSLREALAASGDGRVVHIGARPPARTLPDLDDLQFERRRWSLLPALMSSQVLGFLHAQEAARRWEDVSVSIACVGPTHTDSTRAQSWWIRALYAVIATTPERSARDAVRLLLDPVAHPGAFTSGRYEPAPIAYDPALAERTWALTERLLAKLRSA